MMYLSRMFFFPLQYVLTGIENGINRSSFAEVFEIFNPFARFLSASRPFSPGCRGMAIKTHQRRLWNNAFEGFWFFFK